MLAPGRFLPVGNESRGLAILPLVQGRRSGLDELSTEFRARAQRCLKLARDAPTMEAQTHWLAMAQLWLGLAQHAEEQEALFLNHSHDSETGKNGGDSDENGHSNGDPPKD
jgi:hypothetical protein